MTHTVLVKTFHKAYSNAGMAIQRQNPHLSFPEVVERMETDYNVRSFVAKEHSADPDHYFEFPSEEAYTMFLMKWL